MINPFLEARLEIVKPQRLNLVLEAAPDRLPDTINFVRGLGLAVIDTAFNFVSVSAPIELVDKLAEPDYITVHYDMPRTILSQVPVIPSPTLSMFDPLLGEIRIPETVVPAFKLPTPPFLPSIPVPQATAPNIKIVPTSVSKKVIVDVDTELTGRGVIGAVLDTGAPPPVHPQMLRRDLKMDTTVPEQPVDSMGHGSWCVDAAFGSPFGTRFGDVDGVAPGVSIVSIKCLTTAGFGTTFSVLKAMERAYQYKAKIISMSLGGTAQGGVDNDPEVQVVERLSKEGMIVVIAGGNSGPDKYTIGSPGCAPSALTVAAYSITDDDTSSYSSRGPQSDWYKDKAEQYRSDLSKYGDALIKPDCSAPGGGRVSAEDKPDEQLYSGLSGWYDGYADLVADGFDAMKGTSMATPHVAGLIALLVEGGYINTVEDVKQVLASKGHDKTEIDGYGLIKLSQFVGE